MNGQAQTSGAAPTSTAQTIPVIPPPQQQSTPAPAPEGVTEVKKEADVEPDPKFGARFAALSTKEKQLREQAAAVKTDKAEAARLRAEADAIRAENQEYKALVASAKTDPVKFMERFGLTYQELTNFIINGPKAPAPIDVEKLVDEKLGKERDARKQEEEKARIERENSRIEEGIDYFKGEISEFVDANPADYELILVHEAVPLVFSVVEEFFLKTGEVLEPKVAADYLEAHLLEQSKKIASAKKLAAPPQQTQAIRDKPSDVRDNPKPSPTLTNAGVSASGNGSKPMTDDERRAYAASLLKWS